MVLGNDQAALRGQLDLRVVGKDPGTRDHHISLEPRSSRRSCSKLERDSGLVLLFAGSPTGEEVFIIEEEPPIFENRSGKGLAQRCRNSM